MLAYILEVIFFISAGVVLYLLIVHMPVLEGMGQEVSTKKKSILQEKIAQLADKKFATGAVKFLRRLRLIILKLDNSVAKRLEKMKEKVEEQSQDSKSHILKEVTEGREENDREKK